MMKFNDLRTVVSDVQDFEPYGRTPLGVLAMKAGVISTKDNYDRRERIVREWAEDCFGSYAEGLYRGVNGMRPLKRNREFERGYNHGRKLVD